MTSGAVAEEPGDDPAWQLIQFVRSGRSFSGHERNCVFLNTQGERFADVSAVSGIGFPDDARAVGRVDWDHDGDLDLWISNRNAPQCRFLRNDLPIKGQHWVAFRLEGVASNRDAIGAQVTVQTDDEAALPMIRDVRAGDGYMTQSTKWVHIGLGQSSSTCSVRVRWPSGKVSEFTNLQADTRYRLAEDHLDAEIVRSEASQRLEPQPITLPESSAALRVFSMVRPFLPRLEYLDDQQVTRDVMDLRGTPTLVVLWATWCPACLQELAELTERRMDLEASGLRVLALAVDRLSPQSEADPARAAQILLKLDFPFASGAATEPLMDKLQLVNDYLLGLEKPFPVPTSFLIDRNYRLAAIYRGRLDVEQLQQDLVQLDIKDRDRRPLTVPFTGRWAEDPTTLPMSAFVLELINAGFVEDASEFVQRTQGIYDAATILDLVIRLGMAHYSNGAVDRAQLHFQMARKIEPRTVGPEISRGQWHERRGDYAAAQAEYEAAVGRNPNSLPALNNLAWLLATCPEESVRNGEYSVRLARKAVQLTQGQHAGVLDTFAASLAEIGRFDEAQQMAERAIHLAQRASRYNLAGEIQQRSQLYRQHAPYRLKPDL